MFVNCMKRKGIPALKTKPSILFVRKVHLGRDLLSNHIVRDKNRDKDLKLSLKLFQIVKIQAYVIILFLILALTTPFSLRFHHQNLRFPCTVGLRDNRLKKQRKKAREIFQQRLQAAVLMSQSRKRKWRTPLLLLLPHTLTDLSS